MMNTNSVNYETHRFEKLSKAFEFAAKAHANQYRKSTEIPYISHLMSVSALVFENGGTEDQAIAGLLHDVLEDSDPPSSMPWLREQIAINFGQDVLTIVDACTDGVPDDSGNKPAWEPRKQAYLARLQNKPPEVLLVSCCDKLHNARTILTDLNSIGVEVFNRFSSSREQTLWYYQSLSNLFIEKLQNQPGEIAARTLKSTVEEIKRKAGLN
jgi:(p)ppGpp synthase/HD superfamily hydrolase